MVEHLAREQLALGGLAARVADRTRRAAGDSDRVMSEQLEPPQPEQRHQITDVKTVRGGVKSAVEHDRRGRESFWQLGRIRAIRQQPALLKFLEHVHAAGSKRAAFGPLKVSFESPLTRRF